VTDERTELQRKLADAEAKLEALPLAHQVKHPDAVRAKRAALEAKVASLRQRLSTAPVHNMVRPVEPPADPVDDGPCLDGGLRYVSHDDAQPDPQD
jgi:hypothetical protein